MKMSILQLATVLLTVTAIPAQQEDPNKSNLEALAANAAGFVEAYNKEDPEALAKMFLPDGEIVLADGEVVAGRDDILEFYAEIFAGDEKSKAALEAGSVRFVTPGIAIEDGTLHITKPSGEVSSHYYTAVQVKQENGTWLTASVRDEIGDHAPASEKLIALQWLIGDWLIEKDGCRTFLSFSWSEDGPYLDGKSLTEDACDGSTSATFRIGWNNSRKNFVSWSFDALGGYTKSDWVSADNGWILRTNGVTSDGEINQSTQSFEPDPSLQSYTWSSRDQTIGDEIQPDLSLRAVRRPPDATTTSTDHKTTSPAEGDE